MFLEEFPFRRARPHTPGQWMTDIRGRNTVLLKIILFKRKDAQYPRKVASHSPNPAFAPSPDLGGDQVEYRNAKGLELGCNSEIEVRAVCKNGKIRLFPSCGCHQPPE